MPSIVDKINKDTIIKLELNTEKKTYKIINKKTNKIILSSKYTKIEDLEKNIYNELSTIYHDLISINNKLETSITSIKNDINDMFMETLYIIQHYFYDKFILNNIIVKNFQLEKNMEYQILRYN